MFGHLIAHSANVKQADSVRLSIEPEWEAGSSSECLYGLGENVVVARHT